MERETEIDLDDLEIGLDELEFGLEIDLEIENQLMGMERLGRRKTAREMVLSPL